MWSSVSPPPTAERQTKPSNRYVRVTGPLFTDTCTVPKRGYQLVAPVAYGEEDSLGPAPLEGSVRPRPVGKQLSIRWTAWSLGVLLAIAVVAALVVQTTRDAEEPTLVATPKPHSIIVLPFENLSDDAGQEVFANGITEDIITDLSRLSDLRTIAGNTSFTYKGKHVQPQTLRTDLKVDFVLDGSIRRQGDVLRNNAQLIDAKTGFQK